jgi:hypothetical protein
MSDFALFDGRFGAYRTLFPALAGNDWIMFSDYLVRLAAGGTDVRIITNHTAVSEHFLTTSPIREAIAHGTVGSGMLSARYADERYHEKGILAQSFYIEGSMNITYNGVLIRGEKVTYHTAGQSGRHPKIAAAYLEFDRRWRQLT